MRTVTVAGEVGVGAKEDEAIHQRLQLKTRKGDVWNPTSRAVENSGPD